MLLAIETSTSRSSVALAAADGTVLAAAELGRDRRHGEFVAPAIAQMLDHLDARITELTAVAAGIGPGLYTGLRVGLITAATIATTHDLPCVGVVGPDALAYGLRHATGEIAVALDARRRELYLARYHSDGDGGTPVGSAIEVVTPADAARALMDAPGPVILAGDGAASLLRAVADLDGTADHLRPVGRAHAQPTAAGIVPLAVTAIAAGETGGAEVLRPLYLRDADARIGWDERGRLRGGAATGGGQR